MLMHADSASTRAWFVADFVPDVLELIIQTWEDFRPTCHARLEQRITNLFSDALEVAYEKNGKEWFIVPDMKRTDPRTGKEIARHDIRFFHRDIMGQRLYFIFECKRLNVLNSRGMIASNSAGYEAGMMKFVNRTYGEEHPCGGMIGYVMSGDVSSAGASIKQVISKSRIPLLLTSDGDYAASVLMPGHIHNGETKHKRTGGYFIIYHVLLSLN